MIKGLVHLKILFSLSFRHQSLETSYTFLLNKEKRKEKKKSMRGCSQQAAVRMVKAGSKHAHS